MNNTHVREQLSSYLDKMLTTDENKQIENHLRDCSECRKVFDELETMVSWIKTVPKPVARMGLEARMIARLTRPESDKKHRAYSWLSISSGLATAMVAVVVFVMVRETRLNKPESHRFRDEERTSQLQKRDAAKAVPYLDESNNRKDDKGIYDAVRMDLPDQNETERNVGYVRGSGGGIAREPATSQEKSYEYLAKSKVSSANKPVDRDANAVVGKEIAGKSSVQSKPELHSQLGASSQPPELKGLGEKRRNIIRRGVASVSVSSGKMESSKEENQQEPDLGRIRKREGKLGLRDSVADGPQLENVGFTCDIKKPEQRVIRSKEGWESLLKRMANQTPGTLFPSIDFSKQMVVAVFMGEQPSTGYTIRIVGEEFQDEGRGQTLFIKIRKTFPPKDAMVATALTQPYHLKVLPLFQGPVQFQDVK